MKGMRDTLACAAIAVAAVTTLTAANQPDKAAVSMANLPEMHKAIELYATDNGGYPMMSSLPTANPRTRWPDYTLQYASGAHIYTNPLSPEDMINRKWAHDQNLTWGGYGYNFQYLGNSRVDAESGLLPFTAKPSEISAPGETVMIADTQGVRGDDGSLAGGVYTVDPPLPSARGTTRPSGFYGDGDGCGSGPMGCRSTPAEWLVNRTHVLLVDGQVVVMNRARLDDKNGDGTLDNGWFNGSADPTKR